MKAPRRWERRAGNFQRALLAIEDENLRFALGIIVAGLHDPDDDCAWAVFAPEKTLRLLAVQVDKDIAEALMQRVGEQTFREAIRWLQRELDGKNPAWAAWLLHRVKVHGLESHDQIVGEGVVYDLKKRHILKQKKRGRR